MGAGRKEGNHGIDNYKKMLGVIRNHKLRKDILL
jgi:hypothetical protein